MKLEKEIVQTKRQRVHVTFKNPWNLTKFLEKKKHLNSHSTQAATASCDGSVPGISSCPEPPSQNLHLFRSHAAVDAWAGTPVAHTKNRTWYALVVYCIIFLMEFVSNEMGRIHFPDQNCISRRLLFSLLQQLSRNPNIAMAQKSGKFCKLFHETQLNTPCTCP